MDGMIGNCLFFRSLWDRDCVYAAVSGAVYVGSDKEVCANACTGFIYGL